MLPDGRQRRPHNLLKGAVRDYLSTQPDATASLASIRAATEESLGYPPQSSYRSAMQDERYFVRVSRGVFRLLEPRRAQ